MSWKGARGQLRVLMSGAAAVVVGVTVYLASGSGQPGALTEVRPAAKPTAAKSLEPTLAELPHRQIAQAHTISTPPPTQATAADPEESTIAQYVSEKYQYLLDDLRYLDADQIERLQRALLRREQLAGQGGDSLALANVEAQIRGLLRPADHETYESLKESDVELFKLNEYASGINNVAPLSAADRESILKTKLAYKERFHQLMQDSGLQRTDLSAAEREYAYSVTSSALEGYKRSYLQEVRQYLTNEEQFALLSNYETTEFQAELARLRSMAAVPVQGGS